MTKETVTIVQVTKTMGDPDDMGTISGGERDYYLPGADCDATLEALRGAGFKVVESIGELLDEAAAKPNTIRMA